MSRTAGPELFACMSQGVQTLRPQFPVCPVAAVWHTGVVGFWRYPKQLAVVLVKVVRLLTLESSFSLASDQLRLEEGVFFEHFAFPNCPGSYCLLIHHWSTEDAFLPNVS